MERLIISACMLVLGLAAFNVSALGEEFTDQDFSEYFSSFSHDSPEQIELNLDAFGRHLKLSDNQLDSWFRFKITFLEQAENRQQRSATLKELKSSRNTLSSLEKLKLREHYMQIRLKELRQMIEVVDGLYSLLNKHQKNQFDRAMQYFWSGHRAASRSRAVSDSR